MNTMVCGARHSPCEQLSQFGVTGPSRGLIPPPPFPQLCPLPLCLDILVFVKLWGGPGSSPSEPDLPSELVHDPSRDLRGACREAP